MYRFIEAEREEERSVNRACVILEVSRAAWYEWSKQEPSRREREDLELTFTLRLIVWWEPSWRSSWPKGGCVFLRQRRSCVMWTRALTSWA
jgi:hypothetical protein